MMFQIKIGDYVHFHITSSWCVRGTIQGVPGLLQDHYTLKEANGTLHFISRFTSIERKPQVA